jgi:hypothetical protein
VIDFTAKEREKASAEIMGSEKQYSEFQGANDEGY